MQTINQFKFLIPGKPIAQIRPRFSARIVNGKIISHVTRNQPEHEGYFEQMIIKQLPENFQILHGPLIISIESHFKRPKSHFRTGRYSNLLKKSAPSFPNVREDWDNLGKFVCDVCNGLVWKDDKQIISGKVEKFYAKRQYTRFKIIELGFI